MPIMHVPMYKYKRENKEVCLYILKNLILLGK